MHSHFKKLTILCLILALICSFGVCSSSKAYADNSIKKILTTISATPVALMDPGTITAATSTEGCYIISAGWFDAAGNAVVGAFGTETYRLVIQIGASEGYTIPADCPCYLNNSSITAEISASGKKATLVREYTAAIWAPTIIKNPADETVDDGGWASFVVSASYARDYQWGLQDPAGTTFIQLDDLRVRFPGVETTGNGSSKIMIYHIPSDMNGWKVVCNFIGAGVGNSVPSKPALITVRGGGGFVQPLTAVTEALDTGSLQVDPLISGNTQADDFLVTVASAAGETEPVEAASDTTQAGADPAAHVHEYSDSWSYDARGHWHECLADGARRDEELHNMIWSVTDSETGEETGRCSVCGFTVSRRPAVHEDEKADKPASSFSLPPNLLMWLLCGLLPFDVVCIVLHAIFAGRREEEDYY